MPLSLAWQFNANGHLTAGRLVRLADQSVFLVSSLGRTVYALSDRGELLWQAKTRGPVYCTAVLDEDRWGAGDDAGDVTLFDAGGRRIWQYNLGSRVTALSPNWGGLLAGGWNESLSLLSSEGELRWQAALDGPVSSILALPSWALAATLNGEIRAFDATGIHAWRFAAHAPVSELGAVNTSRGALVLAAVQDGRLLALDERGVLQWEQTMGPGTEGSPVWHVAAVAGEALPNVVVGTGGTLPVLALLNTSGQVLWRIALPSEVGAIAMADLEGDGTDEIVAGLSNGEIQVYDRRGRLRGSAHAGLSVWGLEATDEGSVLVLADVVAWQLAGVAGDSGGPWLSPPAMVPAPPDPLPAGAERKDGEAILVFLGDVSMGRTMEAQLARYGPAYPWGEVGPLLRDADLAVANLEGVLTTHGDVLNKSYLIRAHPRWGTALVEAGLDLVSLANNHVLDYGAAGLSETLATLEALQIASVGASGTSESVHEAALFTLNGVRIAILGYAAARWNGSADVPATDLVAWAEPAAVQAGVRAVHDGADLVVVILHAGTEYAAQPSSDQVAVAHAAIEAGADLVVGHHPHVTQTVDRYGQGLIVYSLGDALFDIPRPAAMQGDLLRVHVTQDGLTRAEVWPFWIENAIRPRFLDDRQGNPRVEIVYP